jgi:hypothetical protein
MRSSCLHDAQSQTKKHVARCLRKARVRGVDGSVGPTYGIVLIESGKDPGHCD